MSGENAAMPLLVARKSFDGGKLDLLEVGLVLCNPTLTPDIA